MTYRIFLFLTFQSCTQFAPNFERCPQPAPTTLQNSLEFEKAAEHLRKTIIIMQDTPAILRFNNIVI